MPLLIVTNPNIKERSDCMKVSILAVGNEVVEGKTVNTNATYLAKQLEIYGFSIISHLAVVDDPKAIKQGLADLYRFADIVITIGGLGPTIDDLTKETVADYFNAKMELNQDVLSWLEDLFAKRELRMPKTNLKQAYFIPGSQIIPNEQGTAPGMIYEQDGRVVIVLPGPPSELIPMFESTVLPYLLEKYEKDQYYAVKHYRLMNIGESHIEEIIEPLYKAYPNLKIAPYASIGVVDYIISTHDPLEKEHFEAACREFEAKLGDYIIGDWSQKINEIIVQTLSEKQLTIATAESCTGGMLASMLVDVPGSSQVFLEGFITYSNEAKMARLDVRQQDLEQYGAVSAVVAEQMARQAMLKSGSDFGLATTGIAGPSGGTVDKPVGLVYMAIAYKDQVKIYRQIFSGDREKVRLRTCLYLMFKLYQDFIKTL